jgi:hypothetical protein
MAPRLLIRLRRDESGYSLVEMIAVSLGMVVILMAILGLADVANKIAPTERERVHAMRDAEVGMKKMTRELRTAHDIDVSSWAVTASILKSGSTIEVTYDCSDVEDGLRTCTRTQTGGSGAGTTTAVERLANASSRPVFTATTRTDGTGPAWTPYVKVLLEVPARGERSVGAASRVVLEDGVYLRNVDALH